MNRKTHWEGIYGKKGAEDVSWFSPHLSASLKFILSTGIKKSDPILDVGAGASTLVDDLLHEGFTNVSVMDISAKALAIAKGRLALKASQIHWIEEDVTNAHLPKNLALALPCCKAPQKTIKHLLRRFKSSSIASSKKCSFPRDRD